MNTVEVLTTNLATIYEIRPVATAGVSCANCNTTITTTTTHATSRYTQVVVIATLKITFPDMKSVSTAYIIRVILWYIGYSTAFLVWIHGVPLVKNTTAANLSEEFKGLRHKSYCSICELAES